MYYLYNDPKRWGLELGRTLTMRRRKCRLFGSLEDVGDEGTVFVHVNHLPAEERTKTKHLMEELGKRPGLRLVPSARQARLYDDKVAEFHEFGSWLPPTVVATDQETAHQNIGAFGFPFISKALQGAGASNLRIIGDAAAAEAEIVKAFSPEGLPCYRGMVQKDYVLWQKWIPGLQVNWRVVILGYKYVIVTKRWNEKDKLVVNDRGKIETMESLDDEALDMVEHAFHFVSQNHLPWAGVDLIRNPATNEIYVLELTCDWPMWWMAHGVIYEWHSRDDYKFRTKCSGIYDFLAEYMIEGETNERLY